MSAPLYNSRIIDTYIRLIKSRYSFININSLLASADMKAYEVADQGHWFTQEQVDRFFERLVQFSGNEHIAREAGRYAASPETLGVMRQYALGLIGPAQTFEIINKATLNFTRSSSYESRNISPNSVEIIVTPHEGVSERPFQCENRIGFFEAIVMMFGYRQPDIKHTACIFKGAPSCRYTITWENSRSVLYKRIGTAVSLLLGITLLFLAITGQWPFFNEMLHVFIPTVLLFVALVAVSEKNELKASHKSTTNATDKLVEQIESNYNTALMTNEIGQVLSSCTHRSEILELVIQIMKNRLDFDRGLIFLANSERDQLVLQAGYGYTPEQRELLDSVSFHLDRPSSRGVFIVSFREQRPFLINDLNEIEDTLSPQSLRFVKKMGTQAFICCPIISEDRSIGLLAVDNVKTKRTLVETDISRLMGIASVIGISLRNAELIEAKERQFNSVLQVLAASIDARDSLTAGHSEKVTEYSVGICNQLELPREEREMIRVAALLHDYGKIGVPDAILKKEGKLTPGEYDIVMTHAEKTREILSRINFEGIYCRIPEIAGAHHEKVDGSGYPCGLTGPDIPLGAKIIAVADYFEAITAKRHYRDPMPIGYALQLLREASGTLFDGQIVTAFITWYGKNYGFDPGEAPGPEVSQAPRIRNRIPVDYRLGNRGGMAVSEDISLRGLFIATEVDDITKGLSVELSIRLGDGRPIIQARGRVAWINRKEALNKPAYPAGFGVEILAFTDVTERVLESFLDSCRNGNSLLRADSGTAETARAM